MAQSVTRRLALLTAIAVLTVGALTGLVLFELAQWDRLAARLAQESQEASLDGIFHSALTRATGEAVSYAATGNQGYAREAADALLLAQSAMAQLRRIGTGRPPSAQEEGIRRLRHNQDELLARVRRSVTQALRSQPGSDAVSQERLEQLYSPEADVDKTWLAVVAWHDNERRALSRSLRDQRKLILALVGTTVLASLIWAILIRALVVRGFVAPTARLARLAQRIAEGQSELPDLPPATGDIGALQDALQRIADTLRPHPALAAPTEAESAPASISETQGAAVDSAAGETPAQPDGIRRALLLAADPAERDLTRAMLQHCGLMVTTAADGGDAAGALERDAFDVIVIEGAPGGDAAAGAQIRDRDGRRIPVIVLSGEDYAVDMPEWFVPGVDAHLRRPLSFFDLHAALARALGGG